MILLSNLLLGFIIGLVPTTIGGYTVLSWRWWLTCSVLVAVVLLRDYAMLNGG